jgi:hypothetical protein
MALRFIEMIIPEHRVEEAKAKKATHYAIVLWILLLAVLTCVILYAKK